MCHGTQELCVGGTLAELMRSGALATANGGIHARRIAAILMHVATGLQHLHACGLTHGDLDPSHVLLQVPPLLSPLCIEPFPIHCTASDHACKHWNEETLCPLVGLDKL